MKLPHSVNIVMAQNSVRTAGVLQTTRMPVRTSSTNDVAATGAGFASVLRIRAIRKAEATNVAASARMAIGAVHSATNAPPSAGPEISATESAALRLPLASSRRLRDTRSVMNTWSARLKSTVQTPVIAATA